MEVLKEWSTITVCSGDREDGCGVALQVMTSDLYQYGDLLGDTDEAMFKCSECGCINSIKVPKGLKVPLV